MVTRLAGKNPAGSIARVELYVGTGGGNFALAQPYGTGCYDKSTASFYETFAANTFDLSNTSLLLTPTGNGYIGLPCSNSWWTPPGRHQPWPDGRLGLRSPAARLHPELPRR